MWMQLSLALLICQMRQIITLLQCVQDTEWLLWMVADGRCWWWAGGYKTKWKVNLIAPQLVHFVLPADSLSRRHHPNIGKIFSPRAVLVYFIPMPHLKIGSVSPHRGTPLAPLLSWRTPPLASLIPKYPLYSPGIQVRGFKSSLWEVAGEHRYWDKARNAKYGLSPR